MPAVEADAVLVSVEAQYAKFDADFKRIEDRTRQGMDRLRKLTERPLSVGADERGAQQAEKAADRKVRAKRREVESEEQAASRISAMVDRSIAARNRDAANAEATANRIRKAGSRSTVANQTRLMSGSALGGSGTLSAPTAAEDKINYLLRDRIDIQARLAGAQAAGNKQEASALRDQLANLRLIEQYKRAGINDDEAAARAAKRLAEIQKRRAEQARPQVENSLRASAPGIRSAVAGLAGAFSIKEISALNDKYIEFNNRLKIAGVEGSNLKTVQDALFQSAQRYGVEVGSLADVYGKAAQAGQQYGASQQDNLKFTNAVAAAVKITGGSVSSARGSILQLGQALQAGTVRAEEFNSLLEGLYPLLQAAASSSDAYSGSVAKLRAAVIDGKLSSQEFFDLILKGSDILEQRAAKATLTTAAGFTTLTNALVIYFGQADQANGVSAALGSALGSVAGNLDTLIPAIAAVGTALAVGYIARMVAAAAATQGLGKSILGAFGGPVGLAISAVTIGVASFAVEANRSAALVAQANAQYDEMRQKLELAAGGASKAADGTAGVGNDASTATPKVNAFAGAVGNLADQLYRQAAAAKAARIQDLQTRFDASRKAEQQLSDTVNPDDVRSRNRAALGRGDFLGLDFSPTVQFLRSTLSGGRTDAENAQAARRQAAVTRNLADQIRQEYSTPVNASDVPGYARGSGAPVNAKQIAKLEAKVAGLEKIASQQTGKQLASTSKKLDAARQQLGYLRQGIDPAAASAGANGGRGRSGPSAETLERRAEAARKKSIRDDEAFYSEREQLQQSQNDALRDATTDVSELARLSREDIASATRKRRAQIDADEATGKYSKAQADELRQLNAGNAILQTQNVNLREQEQLSQRALDQQRAIFASTETELQARLELADTQAERKRIEQQILDNRLKEAQASAAAVFVNPNATQAERDQAGRDLNNAVLSRQAGQRSLDRNYESPYDRYRRQLQDTDTLANDLSQFKVDTLEGITDELTNATKAALGLKGALGDIVGELIRIGIQRKLIGPLADALFGKSDGSTSGALGGILGSIGSFLGGARASGGDVTAGKLYRVNEFASGGRGEGFIPAQSGKIIPLGRMTPMQSGTTVIQPQINVDARGAVMNDQFARDILARADATSRAYAAQAGSSAYENSPARLRKQQLLGT